MNIIRRAFQTIIDLLRANKNKLNYQGATQDFPYENDCDSIKNSITPFPHILYNLGSFEGV